MSIITNQLSTILNRDSPVQAAKKKVAVLFGGRSAEHEVSIRSAVNVINALDKDKYEVLFVGITRDGDWLPGCSPTLLASAEERAKVIGTTAGNSGLIDLIRSFFTDLQTCQESSESIPAPDVVFPVLHGPYGEDGSVQGLLKVVGVPFVGAGVLGSAIGMDKDVMKRLLRESGIPTPNFTIEYRHRRMRTYEQVCSELGHVFFVKPANMGSSVGISRVSSADEHTRALEEAFRYDDKVLLEENIIGREIECSVLGCQEPIASALGEIVVPKGFYSYEAKYVDADTASLEIPAKLDLVTSGQIQELAIRAFTSLCCEGMARVDFFLRNDGTILVNEINTIPGFTDISMYPKLWEASGLPLPKLLDILIELSLDRFSREQKIRTHK